MTDKQKLDAIKAEIHRLVDVRGYDREMANDLLAFMNSLPNEPVSEDLEEAAFDYAEACKHDGGEKLLCVEHFKAGANWQKEQMMAKAIRGHVGQTINGMLRALSDEIFGDMGFTAGDKVKLIIIKED